MIDFINKQINLIKLVFKKGAFHIIIASFVNKFVAFFGSIFIVRLLSKDDYGIYTYAFNLFNYAYLVAGIGLSYAVLRYALLYDNTEKKLGCVNFALRTGSVANIAIIIAIMLFTIICSFPLGYEKAKTLLFIMSIALPFKYIFDLMLCTDRALMNVKRYSFYSLFSSSVIIVSRVVVAYFADIYMITIIYVCCEVIMSLLCYITEKKYIFSGVNEERISSCEKKSMIIYSIQYMITNGIWSLFMLNETTMLGQLSTDTAAVADYKVAYTIPACLSIFTTAIGIFMGPYFTKWDKDKEYSKLRKGFVYTISIGLGVLFVIVLFIVIFGKFLIPFLFGQKYGNVIELTNVLLVASLANSIRSLIANIFASIGKIKINLIIAVLGVVAQLIIGYLVIPLFGGFGLAYADIFIYGGMALAEIIVIFYSINKITRMNSVNE